MRVKMRSIGPIACRLGGHETADMREQHDQRGLAHIGRFAAHVRAGDDQHAPGIVEGQVVRFEWIAAHLLDDRMAAAHDADAAALDQLRRLPVQRVGALGQIGEHIEFGYRGSGLACSAVRRSIEEVEQRFVQRAFAHQRALACRQHLVLERLQFLGDVSFGTFQRLPPCIVRRRLVGLALADLDVVAVHAVVADLQRRDAGGGLFARFEIDQELIGVGRQRAQFIQLGIEAGADHAAVAQQCGRLFEHGSGEVLRRFGDARRVGRAGRASSGLSQPASASRSAGAAARPSRKRRQIARPRRAQGHAREDAFEVADAAQHFAQVLKAALFDQAFDRLIAPTQHIAIAQRTVQPATQRARAHWRDCAIEHAEQGVFGASARMRVEFEIAPRRRVERDRFVRILDRQPGQMRQRRLSAFPRRNPADSPRQRSPAACSRSHIPTGRARRRISSTDAARFRASKCHGARLRRPGRPATNCGHATSSLTRVSAGASRASSEASCSASATSPSRKRPPARSIHARPYPILAGGDREQQIVAAFLEQRLVGHRPRRDDTHHPALDQTLRQRRIADLFADRHRLAEFHEFGQITFDRVIRHAGHRNRRASRCTALGQRDIEQARGLARIVVEQLVEIAHAEKQQRLRMLGLGAQVLAHQRCVGGEIVAIHLCAERGNRLEGIG